LLDAWLTLAYVALVNAHKTRLKELADAGDKRAERAFTLANDATRLLASQQVLDLLLRFAIALIAFETLVTPLQEQLVAREIDHMLADVLAYGGVFLVVTLTALIFGEMLPTNLAQGYADPIALRFGGTMNLLTRVLTPVVHLLQWISGQFAAPFVSRNSESLVTEEEIKLMVDAGQEGGAIEDEEKEMIYSIFQFGDTLAREVMVPRIDMVALDIQSPLREALNIIVEAGHSRIPVYEESVDHIRGLLYAKDLLKLWRDDQMDRPLKDLLRPAHFVPESKKAVDLLTELQQRNIHLAVVVDEYGGTAGLVTLEDLIEEIVGEIRDEYDTNEEEIYQKVGDNEYIIDAGIDLDDLNRLLDADLPTDESDTLGGYVFSKLGEVPVIGAKLEEGSLHMEVLSVDDRRIRKVRLVIEPPKVELEDIREEPAAETD
ncbi:MAG: HlyC/CorC family transporter, partial [Chloroflexi bacterium]|nr:HlyC/CorC family transporter [Chloroflexota bacterium]